MKNTTCLLADESPLQSIYNVYEDTESDHMNEIRDSSEQYALYKIAKCLYTDSAEVSIDEIADPELVNTESFHLVINARVNNQDIIQTPKTPKSKRTITLPAEIMEMVKEYGGMLYDYKPTDRLFPTQKSFLTREMVRGCKLSGVKVFRSFVLSCVTN